jgi:hypothetical protein
MGSRGETSPRIREDTCLNASCGDSFVQAGVEECDDGNDDSTAGSFFFDYCNLGAYHEGWDSMATTVLPSSGAPGIGGSYRRGHASYVWRRDRDNHALSALTAYDFEYICR